MKTKSSQPRLLPIRTLLALLCCASPLSAGLLFEEDFESPDVTGYEQGETPPDRWVRAAQGYGSDPYTQIQTS